MGFSENDRTVISTALSEVCRNVIEYAGKGEVTIESDHEEGRLIITVEDDGPAIEDVEKAGRIFQRKGTWHRTSRC